jgi:hypothetical protein
VADRLRDNALVIVNTGGADHPGRIIRTDGKTMNPLLAGSVLVEWTEPGSGRPQWIPREYIRHA